jgi:hypothetical protein
MRQECKSPFAFRFRKHSVAPNLVDVASRKHKRLPGLDIFFRQLPGAYDDTNKDVFLIEMYLNVRWRKR